MEEVSDFVFSGLSVVEQFEEGIVKRLQALEQSKAGTPNGRLQTDLEGHIALHAILEMSQSETRQGNSDVRQ